jgi:hypothetical protein
MIVRPSPAIAKQLSMLALSLDPGNDERAAAINMFMGGAMLCAFHAKENPGADIDGLMDFVNEKVRETVKEIMAEDGKLN